MGLLDSLYGSPSDQAAIAIGAGLLGPKLRPIGDALMSGMDVHNRAGHSEELKKARALQTQMLLQQLQQQQLQMADDKAKRDFWSNPANHSLPGAQMPGDFGPGDAPQTPGGPMSPQDVARRMLASGNPMLAQQGYAGMQREVRPPLVVGEGATAIDPMTGKIIYDNKKDAAAASQTELAKLIAERDKFPPGHPIRALYDNQIKKISTHAPATNVTVGLQAPYAGQTASGEPIVLQPTNRPGAPPQVLTDPRTGQPIQPPPTNKPPMDAAAMKQLTGVKNLQDAVSEYTTELKTWTMGGVISPTARARMGTKYNNMMLQAKEAYNLGVLNGPDYAILTTVVTDPVTLKGTITPNSALADQATELSRMMGRVGKTVQQVHRRGTQNDSQADPLGLRQ